MNRRSIGGSLATLVLFLALAATPPLAVSAPSPEAVRTCVELNLPKYTNPGTAVIAQYADVETACRAALDDGDVSVQFEPGAAPGRGGSGSGSGGATQGNPTPADGDAGTPASPSQGERESAPTTDRPSPGDGAKEPPSATIVNGQDVVGRAIADAGAGPGALCRRRSSRTPSAPTSSSAPRCC